MIRYQFFYSGWILLIFFFSCKDTQVSETKVVLDIIKKSQQAQEEAQKLQEAAQKSKDSIKKRKNHIDSLGALSANTFVELSTYSDDFVFDMKYATPDNFLKEAVYECPKCFVRASVAKALLEINDTLMKQGYRIGFFDCYRPYSVQKKMWKIFPNPGYVADPKGGSIHNKGAAVDISLVTLDGSFVAMGTEFDYFGKEAHHAYTKLSEEVLMHRRLLRKTMENHGFKTIRTEWWHYNFVAGRKFKISDFRWECE